MRSYVSHYQRCPCCQNYLNWGISADRSFFVQCEHRTCVLYSDTKRGKTLVEALKEMKHQGELQRSDD